jgi:hypothetical protein
MIEHMKNTLLPSLRGVLRNMMKQFCHIPSLRGRSATTDEAIQKIKNNPYMNETKK